MKDALFGLIAATYFALMGSMVMAAGFPPPTEDTLPGQEIPDDGEADRDANAETDTELSPGSKDTKVPDGSEHEQGASSDIPIDLNDMTRIEAGKERFHSTCAEFCHGHKPALFIGRAVDPRHAFETIELGGKGATPMPPWGDVFNAEEIWELVAYIEHLGKQKAE